MRRLNFAVGMLNHIRRGDTGGLHKDGYSKRCAHRGKFDVRYLGHEALVSYFMNRPILELLVGVDFTVIMHVGPPIADTNHYSTGNVVCGKLWEMKLATKGAEGRNGEFRD